MSTEFGKLSDREILILIAERQKEDKKDIEEIKKVQVKHEKFKNTLIGVTLSSLVASFTAFFKSLFN